MQILHEGKNILIREIKNGDYIPLEKIGITKETEIKMLWTIIKESSIFICFDPQTGKKRTRTLKDAIPIHHKNAFAEDRIHDWNIKNNQLVYNAHSTPIGTTVSILIQTKNQSDKDLKLVIF